MILQTNLIPRADALTLTPWLLLIKPRCVGDYALLAHERVHQDQMRRDGTLAFWWRYLTSKKSRYQYELEAYAEQVRRGADVYVCAAHLAKLYGLGVSTAEAEQALLDVVVAG